MVHFILAVKFDFILQEIGPSFTSLVMDPFASHVLRSLLLLLCPNVLPEDAARKSLRSKRSMSWKAKRGHMKSVFSDEKGKVTHVLSGSVPSSFRDAANRFLQISRDGLDGNEVRALATHKVASPVLQVDSLRLFSTSPIQTTGKFSFY